MTKATGMVGISSEKEAQRHAVVNHNPFLGRVTFDQLSVYENGEPQRVFNFPWGTRFPVEVLSFSLNHGMLEPLQSMTR